MFVEVQKIIMGSKKDYHYMINNKYGWLTGQTYYFSCWRHGTCHACVFLIIVCSLIYGKDYHYTLDIISNKSIFNLQNFNIYYIYFFRLQHHMTSWPKQLLDVCYYITSNKVNWFKISTYHVNIAVYNTIVILLIIKWSIIVSKNLMNSFTSFYCVVFLSLLHQHHPRIYNNIRFVCILTLCYFFF